MLVHRLLLPRSSADENNIYLILEMCDGGELFDRLHQQKGNRYSEAEAARLMFKMCAAIGYCELVNCCCGIVASNTTANLMTCGLCVFYSFGVSILCCGYRIIFRVCQMRILSQIASQLSHVFSRPAALLSLPHFAGHYMGVSHRSVRVLCRSLEREVHSHSWCG